VLLLIAFPLSGAEPATLVPTAEPAKINLSDRVKPRPDFPGMLRASDVCMRSLRPRPINQTDPHDTLQAIRDFHVTRLEWTYGLTADFIARVEALGCTASGACANGNLIGISRQGTEWYKDYSALDLDGNAVEAPWMRAWPGHALWHCVNNPAARAGYLNYVKDQVDQGVKDLQRDDPTMNYHATRWGACFCEHCMRGFQAYLKQHASAEVLRRFEIQDPATFDYARYLRDRNAPVGDAFAKYPEDDLKRLFIAFQEQSTIEFHRWWRQELNTYAGRHVPVSSNNGAWDFGSIHGLFDWYIGELSFSRAQPETLHDIARQVEQLGKGQTVTMPLRNEAEETRQWIDTTRRTIATVYALGMHIEAPWDTYRPVRDAVHPPRYFGRPEDYSDLFALVRAQADLLDGYVTAAAGGGMVDDDRWAAQSAPVTVGSASTRAFAFTRVMPGRPDAPIVVHLVDWSGEPKPFTISLNPDVLFAGRPYRITLITPKPYDRAAHQAAFDSRDYSSLVDETPVASGPVTTCQIPVLRPWGLLVLRPLADQADLWPPRFFWLDHQGEPAIGLVSPDRDATVRFTTDGSEPDQDSPPYREPILAGSSGEIRARSYRGDQASTVSILRHLPAEARYAKSLLKNGDFSEGIANWQAVVSQEIGRDALEFSVEKIEKLDGRFGARLNIKAGDGVPYHLRLVQPVQVPAQADLYVTATLLADRPARVRFGIQERRAPYRVIHVGILEVGPEPRRVRLSMTNPHPDLEAQLQLDLGSCPPDTTVWLSHVTIRELGDTK